MKYFIFCVLSTALFAKPIVFNTEEFPPFNYTKNAKVTGPSTEIVKAICKKLNLECIFRCLPVRRTVEEVRSGKGHALYVLGENYERKRWLHYTIAMFQTEYGFFKNKEVDLKLKDINDVKDKIVGVYGPTNTSINLKALQEKLPFYIDMKPQNETSFKKLELQRVELAYSNRATGNVLIKELGLKNVVFALKHKELKYHMGFSKKHFDPSFAKKFSNAFLDLHHEGVIKKILTKYDLLEAYIPKQPLKVPKTNLQSAL